MKRLDGYVFTYAGNDAQEKIYKELSAVKDAGLSDVSMVGFFAPEVEIADHLSWQ